LNICRGWTFFEEQTVHFSVDIRSPTACARRMQIYLFWSEANIKVFGLTLDPEGENLPSALAPWSRNGDGQAIYADPEEDRAMALNSVVRAVQRGGFYLAEIERPAKSLPH
jgi:hypothetical protein